MAPSISIVIPAFNERATIAAVMEGALAVLRACATDFELIVLDDASTDETFEIMARVAGGQPSVRLERHPTNQGIARTFEELYRLATKDFVFLISGDGQFPPQTLARCVPFLETHDIVICRRTRKQYTLYRHAVSYAYRALPRMLFRVDLVDPGGVKVVRREIIQNTPVRSTGVFVEAERLIRAVKDGAKVATVDMEQQPREGGQAHGARLGTVVSAGVDLLRCWWHLSVMRRR